MSDSRAEWAELRGFYAVSYPEDVPNLVRHAEKCSLHREAVAAALDHCAEIGAPAPPELLTFAARALRGELPHARPGRTPADNAFRNLALAREVFALTDRGVKRDAALTEVGERRGMKPDAVRKAVAKVKRY